MPICAWRSAGASLVPSPHMPTTWPWLCRAFTRRYFSSGTTRAKTPNWSALASSEMLLGGQTAPAMPTLLAIAAAVTAESPVTMTVRTFRSRNVGDKGRRILARRIAERDQAGEPQRCRFADRNCDDAMPLPGKIVHHGTAHSQAPPPPSR